MIIVVTEMHLINFRKIFRFFRFALPALKQAKKANGCIHVSVSGVMKGHTLTAWQDEESMKDYKNSGSHKIAMKEMKSIANTFRTVIWEDDKIPNWKEAKRRLKEVEFKYIK